MQGFTDNLVGDVRTVVIAGVDVVHSARDGLPQYGQCRIIVFGRTEHTGPCELHCAVAEPPHSAVAECKCAGLVDTGHDQSPLSVEH